MDYIDFIQNTGSTEDQSRSSVSPEQEEQKENCFTKTKKNSTMKKYLVKLMFNVNVDNGTNTSEFDEQIRIVDAHNLENAFYKARSIGKKEEETFINKENQAVSWNFIDVAELYPLEEIRDGEQVYSNTRKIKDTSSFITYIRQKSMEIQAKNLTFA